MKRPQVHMNVRPSPLLSLISLKDPVVEIQWKIDHDPTHLNQVAKLVSDAVYDLLEISPDKVPSHLDGADLRRFKHIYGLMGFRCRDSTCRTTPKFYKTDQERKAHEKSHRKSFNCMDCDERPSGFSSASALRKHRETYHAKLEDSEVPGYIVSYIRALLDEMWITDKIIETRITSETQS